jgi:predicted RNase H-like nuclease (RuvC/YqgF family)
MSDEELVKRLRELGSKQHADPSTAPEFVFLDPDLPPSEWEKQYSMDVVYVRADRIEALTEQLEAARADAKEAEAYAEELEAKVKNLTKHHSNMADPRYWEGRYRDEKAKLARAVEALHVLIRHAHNCEKELTEELHHQDFCGESLPLTNARTTLAEIEGDKG